MTSSKKGTKVSRITIACNCCRYRKQKCSGNRPICAQCLHHSRHCDWPEQLKRGPEKGYIEALELRLRDTEHLLLRLLSQVSDDQLSTSLALDQSIEDGRNNNREPFSGLIARPAKRGTEYWKKFPLDTAQHVRNWQYDCLKDEQSRSISEEAVLESRAATTPSTGTLGTRSSKRLASQVNATLDRNELDSSPYPSLDTLLPVDASSDVINPTSRVEMRCETHHLNNAAPLAVQIHGMDTQQPEEPQISGPKNDGRSFWSEAPPLTFQDQFLW